MHTQLRERATVVSIDDFVQEWGKAAIDDMLHELQRPLQETLYAIVLKHKPSLAMYVHSPNDMFDNLEAYDLESTDEARQECVERVADALSTYVTDVLRSLEEMSRMFRSDDR